MSEPEVVLYSMDDPVVMLPYEMCETRSKAAYQGWKRLDEVGMIDSPFDPRNVTVRVRWMFRWTADAFAGLPHKYGDPYTPGAFKVWVVEVGPW